MQEEKEEKREKDQKKGVEESWLHLSLLVRQRNWQEFILGACEREGDRQSDRARERERKDEGRR